MPERALRAFLEQHLPARAGTRRLTVAFSGGLDSTVLLQAAVAVAPAFSLAVRALHVHHGLSPHADAWARHAAAECAALGVPLAVLPVRVGEGASLEAAARAARYEALATALEAGDALLMAQHRDDQAETVLFRLLRGAGVTGLAAMRPERLLPLADGTERPLWRPFLGVPREALRRYADARRLAWIEDEANHDPRHARNFLRHAVLPRLRERWPAAPAVLAATASRLAEADTLLDEYARHLGATCQASDGTLALGPFAALSPPQQRLVLRHWLRLQRHLPPDEAVLDRILRDVAGARPDAMPGVVFGGSEIRRFRDRLHVMARRPAFPREWAAEWDGEAALPLPDGRRLVHEGEDRPARPWQVRFRRGGERLRPAPDRPSRELKTLLQEAGVPPWQRDRLPLVFEEGQLIAVVGVALPGVAPARRFRIAPGPGAP